MYILNHGNATGDEEPDDDNVNAANTKSTTNVADPGTSTPALPSKKSNWIFTGWMAFVMWGPLAPENQHLDIFRIGDVPKEDKKASGRSINRKKIKTENSIVRELGSDVGRGLTVQNQVHLATLALGQERFVQSQRESSMISTHLVMNSLEKRIERAENRAKILGNNDEAWEKVDALESELDFHCSKLNKYAESLGETQNQDRIASVIELGDRKRVRYPDSTNSTSTSDITSATI